MCEMYMCLAWGGVGGEGGIWRGVVVLCLCEF